jgi:hypothetical protein
MLVLRFVLAGLFAWCVASAAPGQVREETPVPGHNRFVNGLNVVAARYPWLDGSGRTVSIKEFRFDTADIDLRGRVAPLLHAAPDVTAHATFMATLVGGAGTSDPRARGAARGVRLASSSFVGLLPDDTADYAALDVSVQNHSYGAAIENRYSDAARAYDASVAARPALLHVFSAGNRGLDADSTGPYAGWPGFANVTGSFKMAKNAVIVGAVDSFGAVVPLSSRGPAYDGRVKPDLVAYGADGTSGAAALVSGTAALLQQAYLELHADTLPPAAWTRAVLLNTARDVGAPGPDYASGFGNLDADAAVHTALSGAFRLNRVGPQTVIGYEVAVPAGLRRLKVLLAWDDVPAASGAARALVQDLDLYVDIPGSPFFVRPLTLSTAANADSLARPARPGRDSLNTVEQVLIDFPAPGLYRFEVHGHTVAGGEQPFALTWTWDSLDAVQWTYPSRGDVLPAGAEVVLRWQGTTSDSAAALDYRLLSQADWTMIDAAQPLAAGTRRFTAPGGALDGIVFRLRTAATLVWSSDTAVLAPPVELAVALDCADSIALQWNRVDGADHYRLWKLGARYLETFATTTDTFVVLPQPAIAPGYVDVTAVAAAGWSTETGQAILAPGYGAGCYINAFFADLYGIDSVGLALRLGSTYGLEQVELWEITPGQPERLLASWSDPLLLEYRLGVPGLSPGPHTFLARVERADGQVLESEALTVIVPEDRQNWAFPNPVDAPGTLIVVSDRPGAATFLLGDATGRLVLEQPLTETFHHVALPTLPAGVYVYWFRFADRPATGGRLVVRP